MTTHPLGRPSLALALLACTAAIAPAAEMIRLGPENWDHYAPQGKEADAIYGDVVLRNDQLVAVIGHAIAGRNANLTVRNVNGAVIDLSRTETINDQLSAYYPGAARYWLREQTEVPADRPVTGDRVEYVCRAAAREGGAAMTVRYSLQDGWDFLQVEIEYANPQPQAIEVELLDSIRADRFSMELPDGGAYFYCHDPWWLQAYAVLPDQGPLLVVGDSLDRGRPVLGTTAPAGAHGTSEGTPWRVSMEPGQSLRLTRKLVPGANALEVRGRVARLTGAATVPVHCRILDPDGPIDGAELQVYRDGALWANGRTGPEGQLRFALPPGPYRLVAQAIGRPVMEKSVAVDSDTNLSFELERAGYVVARIRDTAGRPIACKVEFRGRDADSPYFGPDTFVYGVRNLRYTPNGDFRQAVAPGIYDVIISHGPEYDAVFRQIQVERGEVAMLEAQLQRSVDTSGWISSDFHGHSSPSGDTASSPLGRVLNLLAEHIEFAPCTEHNRITTYDAYLQTLEATERMATCPGMELTGNPLPINHQNAFPMTPHHHHQDGGGPRTDADPVIQIERLAMWEGGGERVVQGNHPNLPQIFGDRDRDGQPDGGFRPMLGYMDVVEVHPLETVFTPPRPDQYRHDRGSPIYHWMQLLNLGYRIPGTVNTDAHYNFHGSGWRRNYIRCSTDDPAEIRVEEIVESAEAGRMVMTNGPFLEVVARHGTTSAGPGEDLLAEDGRVDLDIQVQCANWLDVNRVQVFVNGRPREEWNFTRSSQAELFRGGTLKFRHTVSVRLEEDAHLIVVAAGEGLGLGPVAGPSHQDDMPVAVANPIFVDLGGGFQPSLDPLDVPLPHVDRP